MCLDQFYIISRPILYVLMNVTVYCGRVKNIQIGQISIIETIYLLARNDIGGFLMERKCGLELFLNSDVP